MDWLGCAQNKHMRIWWMTLLSPPRPSPCSWWLMLKCRRWENEKSEEHGTSSWLTLAGYPRIRWERERERERRAYSDNAMSTRYPSTVFLTWAFDSRFQDCMKRRSFVRDPDKVGHDIKGKRKKMGTDRPRADQGWFQVLATPEQKPTFHSHLGKVDC